MDVGWTELVVTRGIDRDGRGMGIGQGMARKDRRTSRDEREASMVLILTGMNFKRTWDG